VNKNSARDERHVALASQLCVSLASIELIPAPRGAERDVPLMFLRLALFRPPAGASLETFQRLEFGLRIPTGDGRPDTRIPLDVLDIEQARGSDSAYMLMVAPALAEPDIDPDTGKVLKQTRNKHVDAFRTVAHEARAFRPGPPPATRVKIPEGCEYALDVCSVDVRLQGDDTEMFQSKNPLFDPLAVVEIGKALVGQPADEHQIDFDAAFSHWTEEPRTEEVTLPPEFLEEDRPAQPPPIPPAAKVRKFTGNREICVRPRELPKTPAREVTREPSIIVEGLVIYPSS
jgi:hypothetical protein